MLKDDLWLVQGTLGGLGSCYARPPRGRPGSSLALELAMTQLAVRLTVASADLPLPACFLAPFKTVAFKITKAVLYIYVEANCHPLDWDVAAGLMARISARPRVASWLAHLDEWMVEQVSCAAHYLT